MSLGVHGSPRMVQAPVHARPSSRSSSRLSSDCHPKMRIPDQVLPDARRALPQLDRLLDDPAVTALSALYGREPVKVQARRMLAALRERLGATPAEPTLAAELAPLPERPAAEPAAAPGGGRRRRPTPT